MSFKTCPRHFRLKYIDRVREDDFETVERFLGKSVHSSLEWLYLGAMRDEPMDCHELLGHFQNEWDSYDTDCLIINREGAKLSDYFALGIQCLRNYYMMHAPFADCNAKACEMRVNIDLLGDGRYIFQGFIDRLDSLGSGAYEIHDYKTGANMMSQARADKDAQLALYELGIRQAIDQVVEVGYVWHFLRHGRTVRSKRDESQMSDIKAGLVSDIHRIDEAIVDDFFPRLRTPRCAWCEYNGICEKEGSMPETRQSRLFQSVSPT